MDLTGANPILVTGSHRSGSTWVGNMLSLSPAVGYIHEPFNPELGICKASFDYWYTYVCKKNESIYVDDIRDCLKFKYSILKEAKTVRSFKDIGRFIRDKTKFSINGFLQKRPLVKDPISIFSATWLADRFNMDVIVLIRHPAAFAGSLKKAGWEYPFDHFLRQPLLMETYLQEYKSEIQNFVANEKDIVDQAILLWNIIHSIILKYQKKYQTTWIFKRHEDLSKRPVEEFEEIFKKLRLNYTDKIKNKIKEYCFSDAKSGAYLKRNSKANIWNWQNQLTDDEIARIKKHTYEIAKEFYSGEDWIKQE